MDSLETQLNSNNIEIVPEWSGAIQRNKSQWFVGKKMTVDGHEVSMAWFGDYKTGKRGEWNSGLNGAGNSKAVREQVEAALAQERVEREKVWGEVAETCQRDFTDFSELGTTPYLDRKGIPHLFGARIKPNDQGHPILIVPLRDVSGKLWNYQRIYAKKLSQGDKFFEPGARIDGCFHVCLPNRTEVPLPETLDVIYVCEGFATACSVQMALGAGPHRVVASFNAGNLQSVCESIRQKYANARIVLCADNDAFTVINGREDNVGLRKGRGAAGACSGSCVWPVFKNPTKGFTDFNDLHMAEGLEKVKDQIINHGNYVAGIQPMILPVKKNGQAIQPSEKQVADYLIEFYSGRLVSSEKDLFMYYGTHWEELSLDDIKNVYRQIGVAAQGTYGIREIKNTFEYLRSHLPTPPKGISFFQPNPWCANFQNGTLHIVDQKLEFRPHAKGDYLTSVLPYDYPDVDAQCPQFDEMVERLWGNNLDLDQINDLIDEVIGNSLCPAWSIILFFVGPSGSGKSTIIKLLVRLVNEKNTCNVQLSEMHGFNLESMPGKLVNYDTDIDLTRPMNDSQVKKLIDRMPHRVRRKGRSDVYANLPGVHLFAANGLPKSLDGSSHAYGRRLIIVQTDSWRVGESPIQDFDAKLLKEEAAGILARGIFKGIPRLLANGGRFTVPQSSHKKVQELEVDSDIVEQFIEEIRHGEILDKNTKLVLSDDARVERKNLWAIFDEWQEASIKFQSAKLGKTAFFHRIESKGYRVVTVKGVRYFAGMGQALTPDGIA